MNETIVPFPAPEEERAHRLRVEVDRLARMSQTEWMYYVALPGYAEKYGVNEATLKRMVEAVVKENEKKAREDRGELRRREDRAEKQQTAAKRESERKQERQEREEERRREREEREARKEAERKDKEKQKAFAAIVKLPVAEHESKLATLARQLDENVEVLHEELALLLADAEAASIREMGEPWPEPVNGKDLLDEILAQLRRYVVIHNEASATIYTLTVPFAWVHDEIATYSPILVIEGADSDVGKSILCQIHRRMTPRSCMIVKPTGPSLYRLVDHHHPTLYIDNADKLLPRDSDLADIVNSSWMRDVRIPRTVKGEIYEFNPFCFKIINGIDLLPHLDSATRTRCISTEMLPKLPEDDEVVHLKHASSDERFVTLRRKAMRWSIDNMDALKNASPSMPDGFSNRLAENFALLFAIADRAGGDWPKKMRTAAVKTSRDHDKPSLRRRLLAIIFNLFVRHGALLTAKQVEQLVPAEDDEFANWQNSGRPINKYQIAYQLRAYHIGPRVIHPRGKPADRGYDGTWPEFKTAFK